LQDKDPSARIKAIRELELIADPEALDTLRSVYDSDSNVDVRKAAQEAGRSIFLKNQVQNG
jgi:HEAT repeat protein